MSFDFADRRLAWIPVSWPGLVQKDDAGIAEAVTHQIEIQIELFDRDRINEINDRFNVGDNATPLDRKTERDREIAAFQEMAHDWRGVKDRGVSVPFSAANLARMVAQPGFPDAFNKAYLKALAGVVEEREKNSATSPANGRAARGRKT